MNPELQAVPAKAEDLNRHQILERAAGILTEELQQRDVIQEPQQAKTLLCCHLTGREREVFAVLLLDSQHRLLAYEELFLGTL